MFTRPVHIGLSPNLRFSDSLLALKLLLTPWHWQRGNAVRKVEQWFQDYFKVEYAVSFNAGRSALLAILEGLQVPKNSEVMLQAFTCAAVPNSVVWAGLKPVFVDIDRTLNFDVADAQKKLTDKTWAVIVQHTFGVPANMDKVVEFCRDKNLLLIEDCAHAFGAKYKGKLVGTFGDAAMFSFGRDKIISSVFGGMAITNNKNLGNKITQYVNELPPSSLSWIGQQLLHPTLTLICLYLYEVLGLGKLLLYLFQKLALLSFPVYNQEKQGQRPLYFPRKYPNALAQLALSQLTRLESLNDRRRQIAKTYISKLNKTTFDLPKFDPEAVYLRFTMLTAQADQLRFRAKKAGMILGNWYANLIDPKGTNMKVSGYTWGSCPQAEKAASQTLNLPTCESLSEEQIQAICELMVK